MASGSSFTWGSLIDPVGKTMKHYGIDPHLGIDMLVASFVLVLIAFFAGIKYRKNKMVEPSQNLSFSRVVEIAVAKLYFFSKGFLGDNILRTISIDNLDDGLTLHNIARKIAKINCYF